MDAYRRSKQKELQDYGGMPVIKGAPMQTNY